MVTYKADPALHSSQLGEVLAFSPDTSAPFKDAVACLWLQGDRHPTEARLPTKQQNFDMRHDMQGSFWLPYGPGAEAAAEGV